MTHRPPAHFDDGIRLDRIAPVRPLTFLCGRTLCRFLTLLLARWRCDRRYRVDIPMREILHAPATVGKGGKARFRGIGFAPISLRPKRSGLDLAARLELDVRVDPIPR